VLCAAPDAPIPRLRAAHRPLLLALLVLRLVLLLVLLMAVRQRLRTILLLVASAVQAAARRRLACRHMEGKGVLMSA
jgi:hypothetical protein